MTSEKLEGLLEDEADCNVKETYLVKVCSVLHSFVENLLADGPVYDVAMVELYLKENQVRLVFSTSDPRKRILDFLGHFAPEWGVKTHSISVFVELWVS